MSGVNKTIKRKALAQKYTKKTSAWKGSGEVASVPMKIDKKTIRDDDIGTRRPKLPRINISEKIDTAVKYGTMAAKAFTKSAPTVIAYTAGQEAMGLLTGRKRPDPKTITGSKTLDVISHPLPLMYKATKKYVKQKEDSKKGIYRDPFAGKIRTRS